MTNNQVKKCSLSELDFWIALNHFAHLFFSLFLCCCCAREKSMIHLQNQHFFPILNKKYQVAIVWFTFQRSNTNRTFHTLFSLFPPNSLSLSSYLSLTLYACIFVSLHCTFPLHFACSTICIHIGFFFSLFILYLSFTLTIRSSNCNTQNNDVIIINVFIVKCLIEIDASPNTKDNAL